MNRRLRHKTARALPWAVLESVGLAAVGLVSTVVLARLLTPLEFGAAAVAIAVVMMAEILVTAPFVEALIQRRPLDTLHADTAFWSMAVLGAAAAAVIAGLAFPLARAFDRPEIGGLLALQGLSALFTGLAGVPEALLSRKLRLKALAQRTIASRLAATVATIGLAVLGWGAFSIVVGMVLGKAIATLTLWLAQARLPKLRFSRRHLGELLGFGAFTTLERGIAMTATRLFAVLVGYFHGLEALGYVNLAFRVVDAASGFFHTVTTRLGLPLFSSLRGEPERLKSAFTQSTRLAALVVLPVFAGLIVTAPDVVLIVFGERWLPAVPVLQIIAALSGIGFARTFVSPLLKALSRPGLLVLPALVALVVTVVGVIATAGTTVVWATAVWAMRTLVTQPITTLMLARFGGLSARDQFRPVAGPLLAAILMIAAVAAVRGMAPDLAAVPRLGVSIAAGVVSYCGLVLLFDRQTVLLFFSFLGDAASHATGRARAAAALGLRPEPTDDP